MASFKHTFTSGQTVTPARLNDARDVFDIVNADIKSDAAIAGTKISPNFGSQNLLTTGNVGIGTVNPNTKLQVAGGVIRVEANGGEGGHVELLNVANNNVQALFDVDASDVTRVFVLPSGPLSFGTSSAERMRIDASGNVGIGTTTPRAALHTSGDITTPNNSFIGSNVWFDSANLQWKYLANGTAGVIKLADASGDITFQTGANNTSGANAVASIVERMRVKTTGQVRFQPLASDPSGAETGDVYYNSATNKLKVYNGTSWVDLH